MKRKGRKAVKIALVAALLFVSVIPEATPGSGNELLEFCQIEMQPAKNMTVRDGNVSYR
jgi:hypothetical protein